MSVRIGAFEAAAAGVVLLVLPSLFAHMLFGSGFTETGIAMARFAGVALLVVGFACWPASATNGAAMQTTRALLLYNVLMAVCLIYIGIGQKLAGLLLWPAVGFHIILSVALLRYKTSARSPSAGLV